MSEAVGVGISLDDRWTRLRGRDRAGGLDQKSATEQRPRTKRSKRNLRPLPLLMIAMLAPPAAAPVQAREMLSPDVHAAANRSRLGAAQVRNLRVDAQWRPDGRSFWYRRDTPDGGSRPASTC